MYAYHFICENYHKNLQFLNFSYEFPLFYQKYVIQNLQFCQKMSPLHFQLCDSSNCMPIIESELFPKNKSSILPVILCNAQFHHTHVRLKSSVHQKISPLPFQLYSNYIWMPIVVSEFFIQKNLQFYQLSYVKLNFIKHMLD